MGGVDGTEAVAKSYEHDPGHSKLRLWLQEDGGLAGEQDAHIDLVQAV